jgi:hypothetical protein
MQRTNLEIVLIRQRIINCFDLRDSLQNKITHLVHSRLHTRAIILGKNLHSDIPRSLPRAVEVHVLDLPCVLEKLPLPPGLNLRAENTIPRLRQLSKFIAVEAMERTPRTLQHEQLFDLGSNGNTFTLACDGLDHPGFLAVAEEGVRVRLSVDVHARPAVLDDFNVGGVDVRVCVYEVVADDGGELFGRVDGVLLCEDVGGLLLGVGCDDDGVVGLGVAGKR